MGCQNDAIKEIQRENDLFGTEKVDTYPTVAHALEMHEPDNKHTDSSDCTEDD